MNQHQWIYKQDTKEELLEKNPILMRDGETYYEKPL